MRVRAGWVGTVVTIIAGVLLFWFQAPLWTRFILFFPAFVAAIGFLQANMHFCVAFASKGLFNMKNARGVTESVEKAEFRKADQKKAVLIWIYAFIIALLLAYLGFVI
jgi:hypothetical protein